MIAVSSLYAIQFVLDTYNDIKRDYPNLEVTIVFGQQQEILEYLACGKADLAVVSAETRTGLCLETAFVKFEPRTLRLDESGVLLQPRSYDAQAGSGLEQRNALSACPGIYSACGCKEFLKSVV